MKRSSSPENDDGPAQKRLTKKRVRQLRQVQERCKQLYKQVDTSGTVIWSGTVKIPDSQQIACDCFIKAPPRYAGIKSVFPQKQLTIHSISISVYGLLERYEIELNTTVLCMDENTDMMSCSAFCQAIGFDWKMMGCTVLKSSASVLHLLCVHCFPSGQGDYILGFFRTYQANDTVLGILRSRGLLPCGNPEHEELVKQITRLKEELQYKDKKLTEQQWLNQKLVKRHKKKMAEKERKHEEERNMMEEQMRDKERTITTLDRKIKDVQHVQHEKEKLVTDLYGEFQCSICHETIIEAHYLTPCKHLFCKLCIEEWWKMNTTCPTCRCKAEIIPYPGFDKAVDRVIENFGKKAKEARDDAVNNRAAFIELMYERSFLVSSEESEGESTTSEGESMISEEESVISEEEEMVPEHSCRMTELEASFVGPRESSADHSCEESLSEAAEGEQLHREPEEIQTTSFFSTLSPFLPLSSPSSSEDEPTLSCENQM